jgi:hypothetical protein
MPATRRRPAASRARPAGLDDDVRRRILLLETAAVLDSRADRAPDPAQAATLRRRAAQRRREAEAIRDGPAGEGVVAERSLRTPRGGARTA